MSAFKQYKRKQIAEIRAVDSVDLEEFNSRGYIVAHETRDNVIPVSISSEDLKNGSPLEGDMIARNPKNHLDQWLIAEQYFKDNFEVI